MVFVFFLPVNNDTAGSTEREGGRDRERKREKERGACLFRGFNVLRFVIFIM